MRYSDMKRREILEARAKRRQKATEGPAENKALSGPPENKAVATQAVTFASERAAEVAEELDVDVSKLRQTEPSGAGGYTVADVRKAADG